MTKTPKWVLATLGAVLGLMGLGLAAGGLYLMSLGGSWFYFPAGIALAATGLGVLRRRSFAVWIALALLLVSAAWSFWEVGTDFWQLVPRPVSYTHLTLPTILLV